ncbi:ABC transporter permease [Agrococcus versicolor]|uniref:ABC transporter permease n=1 Tax=Agrococcus versicolor TaxID=501482 RepID=A0ABN3AXF5_9MICO
MTTVGTKAGARLDSGAAHAGGAARARRWAMVAATRLGLLVVLLAAWQVAATVQPNPHLPPPMSILDAARRLFVTGGAYLSPETAWLGNALPTIARALAGFALGSLWGVTLGVVVGLSRPFRVGTGWVIEFLRALPASAVLPLFIVVLGGTDAMRIAFIAWTLSLYLVINAAGGVASVEPTLILMGRSLRLRRAAIVRRIILPAALPQIFAGLRIGTNSAIILAIVSELFVASDGIGYQIRLTGSSFDYRAMWAWILLLSLVGVAINVVVELVERRVLGWHRRSH